MLRVGNGKTSIDRRYLRISRPRLITKAQHRIVLGRGLLVQNLLGHLLKGTWSVVAGGPKIGKTTLLQQVAGNLLDGIRPVMVEPMKITTLDFKTTRMRPARPVILLIDGCEVLLPDPGGVVRRAHQRIQKMDGAVRAVVWAGGVAWGEWAIAHKQEFGHPIRYYPLVVLPPKEARPILLKNLPQGTPASEVERLLDLSGGHPYLLKRLVEGPEADCDSFFAELWKAAGSIHEQAVLQRLVSAGTWVSLEDLRDTTGRRPTKATLDRLAILGLIHRTLVAGAAAARIVSPLLVDWVRRSSTKLGSKIGVRS